MTCASHRQTMRAADVDSRVKFSLFGLEWQVCSDRLMGVRQVTISRGFYSLADSRMPVGEQYKRRTQIRLRGSVAARYGRLLTPFVDLNTMVRIECARGHVFAIRPRHVFAGQWCVACADVERELLKVALLNRCDSLAKARGGEFLSGTYKTARTLMDWRCHRGHSWSATLDNVLNKESWCPVCARGGPRKRRTGV